MTEQRQRIGARIKELTPAASNRQIAHTLGVDEGTIRNDAAENSSRRSENGKEINGSDGADEENSSPALSGSAAAKLAARRETVAQDLASVRILTASANDAAVPANEPVRTLTGAAAAKLAA
jgi:hypothetical protein